MKKILFTIFILALIFAFFSFNFVGANKEQIEINFFYGRTCPHCAAEQRFLDEMEKKYPEIKINRYLITEPESIELLKELCQKCGAQEYLGLVPLTFIGDKFFVGFDNADSIGKKIESAIKKQLGQTAKAQEEEEKIRLPIIGEINPKKYSLPALAVIFGFLDGFNVCSLGALVLILGLVLTLRSRRKIIFFGGIFILTTVLIYGILIILWYQLFSLLVSYVRIMEILIGALGLGGGIYFLKQFIKYKKHGPACEAGAGQKIASKFSSKIQESFKKPGNILALAGIVLLFAAVITIVEFPCSAVIPVIFAGLLSKTQLPALIYILYIAIFLLFYMLDEIIVFLIAVFKMSIWLSSGKFVTWITLIEAVALFLLGFYYLIGF